ncbi:MAG TPA: hypothetical protein VMT19_13645 [Thermoanaerobaculaceae bacterium]|nr:hypothetical protein [Thermoanaerobaculaceae bacterium]
MGSVAKRALRHVLGWGSLLLGLAGLVLPVLQGWLFLAIGALLLSPDVPVFARALAWFEDRFPRLRAVVGHARRRIAGNGRGGDEPPADP